MTFDQSKHVPLMTFKNELNTSISLQRSTCEGTTRNSSNFSQIKFIDVLKDLWKSRGRNKVYPKYGREEGAEKKGFPKKYIPLLFTQVLYILQRTEGFSLLFYKIFRYDFHKISLILVLICSAVYFHAAINR